MRRFLAWSCALAALAITAFLALGPGIADRLQNPVAPHEPWPVSPSAQALHDRLIIGDLHADALLWDRDLTRRHDRGHVDLPRLREGNVAFQVFTTVTKSPSGLNYDHNSASARDNITALFIGQLRPPRAWFDLTERALVQAEALERIEATNPELLRVVRTVDDIDDVLRLRAKGQEIVGAILGAEGGHALSGDPGNLDRLYDAGFRLIGLTHFFDNELGGSLHGEDSAENGLSDFGRKVVRGMVERGMIIDLAHASVRMARDVLRITDVPVIVSHTGIYGHCPSRRNFPDDLMRDIAATGGVIGIGYWADVTCDDTPKGIADAIVAAIALVGEDHVALGSDFDGAVRTSLDTSELAALTQALMDRGLSETTIAKVMGGNMLRVMREVLPQQAP